MTKTRPIISKLNPKYRIISGGQINIIKPATNQAKPPKNPKSGRKAFLYKSFIPFTSFYIKFVIFYY